MLWYEDKIVDLRFARGRIESSYCDYVMTGEEPFLESDGAGTLSAKQDKVSRKDL
jgi:hypothetical protein